MPSYVDKHIPLVTICNISETFYNFLSRADNESKRQHLIHGEQYRGDRTLLWLGDPKLVFVTYPIPHAEHILTCFGYKGTSYMAPVEPSPWLSLDILREPALLQCLVNYAGPQHKVQLIPYATTPQFFKLVSVLEEEYGLTVLLPESPIPDNLWVRDYIDTKAGFRALAPRWLPDFKNLLPEGIICQDLGLAADVVHWYCHRGISAVIKADIGENGIGNILRPGKSMSREEVLTMLQSNSFLSNDWVTVERFIHSDKPVSPSLEMFVPPLGSGEPEVTYVSNQLFLEFGDFCGVVVTRELQEESWYSDLVASGKLLAKGLQEMGYVGHFDLDAVVGSDEKVYLLEVNSRRTGGTHVHEFAKFVFGHNYLDHVVLLSHDAMKSGDITNFDDLLAAIGDLAYPINGEQQGVVVTVTSALEAGEFGCIIVASTAEEALELQQALVRRFQPILNQQSFPQVVTTRPN